MSDISPGASNAVGRNIIPNATPVQRIVAIMQYPLRDSLAAKVFFGVAKLLGIRTVGGAVAQRAAWSSTAIVAFLLTAAGCLLIIPGEEATAYHINTNGRQTSDSRVDWALTVEHGFPFVYLVRTLHELNGVGNYSVTRGAFDAWRLTDRVSEFRLFALAADALLVFGIVVLATTWWARRRRSPTRSAIVVLTMIALLMGPVGIWCQRQRAANQELLARFDTTTVKPGTEPDTTGVGNWAREVEPGFSDDVDPPLASVVGPAPSGPLPLVPRLPLWLRELVGDERLLPFGVNQPDWSTVQWQTDDEVGRFLAGWRPGRIEFGWKHAFFESLDGPNDVPDMTSMSGLEHLSVPADFPSNGPLTVMFSTEGSAWTSDSSVAFVEKVTNLRSLLLNVDGLTDATLARLKGLRSLETLEIHGGEFTDKGLANLAGMKHLRLLCMPSVYLTDATLAEICNLHGLEELEFNGSMITSAGLQALSELRNLKRLIIRSLHVRGDDLRFMSNLTELKELSLALIVTDGNGLQPLRSLRNLRSLNFFWSTFNDGDLRALQPMPQLEKLDIGLSCVTLRGIRNLKGFPNLRDLSLTGLDIGDEAVPELAALPSLVSVNVAATNMTDAGKSRLSAFKPQLEIVGQ